MKQAVIRSTWMEGYGYRLDCSPYLGGALETKVLLEKLPLRKDPLHTLTAGFAGGIYNGPQFVRNYVESETLGVPFLTGSSMQLADLSNIARLSKRDAYGSKLRHLEIHPGMSLISCSGTIGKMAYARREFKGVWSSQDILKIVADPAKIPSGYLYAYLSSKFGVPLVISGTYGAIIQHLEPEHIADLPVPRIGDALEREIHALVEEAGELRTRANETLARLAAQIDERISGVELRTGKTWMGPVESKLLQRRMDVGYYSPTAWAIRKRLSEGHHKTVGEFCSSISLPGIFKRIHVDEPTFAARYFTGASLFCIEAEPKGYLSRKTSLFDEVQMHHGMILVQAFGSEGGLNGRPVWVGKHLDGATTTHMLVRLKPSDPALAGLLFVFLMSKAGYHQMAALSYGGAIPHFDEDCMGEVVMPLFDAATNLAISKEAEAALSDRDKALDNDLEARARIERALVQKAGVEV